MIVLDHDPVVKADAVVRRTADRDRILFKVAVTGRRLARIEDLGSGPLQRRRVLRSGRRHAAEPLQKIQRGPFRDENAARRTGNLGDDFTVFAGVPVVLHGPELQARLDHFEHTFGDLDSGQHHLRLLAAQHGGGGRLFRNDRSSRHVSGRIEILVERKLDQQVRTPPVDLRNRIFLIPSFLLSLSFTGPAAGFVFPGKSIFRESRAEPGRVGAAEHAFPETVLFQKGTQPGKHTQVKFMLVGAGHNHHDQADRHRVRAAVVDAPANQRGGDLQAVHRSEPDMRDGDAEPDAGAQQTLPGMDAPGDFTLLPRTAGTGQQPDQLVEHLALAGPFEHNAPFRPQTAG